MLGNGDPGEERKSKARWIPTPWSLAWRMFRFAASQSAQSHRRSCLELSWSCVACFLFPVDLVLRGTKTRHKLEVSTRRGGKGSKDNKRAQSILNMIAIALLFPVRQANIYPFGPAQLFSASLIISTLHMGASRRTSQRPGIDSLGGNMGMGGGPVPCDPCPLPLVLPPLRPPAALLVTSLGHSGELPPL